MHVCIKAAVACSQSECSCLKVSRKVVYVVFEILNVDSVFPYFVGDIFRSVFCAIQKCVAIEQIKVTLCDFLWFECLIQRL